MKVQQAENNKCFIFEQGTNGRPRWIVNVQAVIESGAASQEELEWIAGKIVEALDGKDFNSFGCYCDLLPGEEPEGCVIDEDMRQACNFASGMNGRKYVDRKENCPHWRRK